MAFFGQAPASRARDFGDQLADMEQLEKARDPRGKTTYVARSLSVGEEPLADIAVAKAHDGMFSRITAFRCFFVNAYR